MATKGEKTKILDELVATSGYHRKHAIRLLVGREPLPKTREHIGQRIYTEAVKEALVVVWEAADRMCGKRLKVILPDLVRAMERHGHLCLDSEVRSLLFKVSAATIDRLLSPIKKGKSGKKNRRSKRVRKQIPTRTFADWTDPEPGYLEIDFVVHGGGSMAGSFIHTLVATDVCSGWTECIPLLAREQSLVVEGLEVLGRQFPMPILGINSDNDSAFINDTLIAYCKNSHIEFTRSRPYRKNDQAWIEQKNGAVVRRNTGYSRFSGIVAGQAMAQLFQSVRLHVNYFQPSFKLRKKTKCGSKTKRTYHVPATPCRRLLDHPGIPISVKDCLRSQQQRLDPVELLYRIRESQSALAALTKSQVRPNGLNGKSLEQFLAQLPNLWRQGEVRPTHNKKEPSSRWWRTRKDPFLDTWPQVLQWLHDAPDETAKNLFLRLQAHNPGRFKDGQLRTLQRRVKEWRKHVAKTLVYECLNECDQPETLLPVDSVGS